MDPLYNDKGELYAPKRFEFIVKQEYFISKFIHTSVTDIDMLTPRERDLLFKFAEEEQEAALKRVDEMKNKRS